MMRPMDALQRKDKNPKWHQVGVAEQALCLA